MNGDLLAFSEVSALGAIQLWFLTCSPADSLYFAKALAHRRRSTSVGKENASLRRFHSMRRAGKGPVDYKRRMSGLKRIVEPVHR
jgi:hypothetical protein